MNPRDPDLITIDELLDLMGIRGTTLAMLQKYGIQPRPDAPTKWYRRSAVKRCLASEARPT